MPVLNNTHRWLFEDNLNDSVGSLTLTASNTAYSTEHQEGNKSIQLTGTSSELSAGTIDLGSTFSISMWLYAGSRSNLRTIVCNTRSDSAQGFILYLNDYNTEDKSFVIGTGSGSFSWLSSADDVFIYDQWNHVVLTINAGTPAVKLYFNGSEVTLTGAVGASIPSNAELQFGRSLEGPWPYVGYYDDIQIYDRVLDQSDVTTLYSEHTGVIEVPFSSTMSATLSASIAGLVESQTGEILFTMTATSSGSMSISGIIDSPYTISKNRVIVLTDLLNEPDDSESLVRLLMYANHIDIEGIIINTSYWKQTYTTSQLTEANDIITAYGQVVSNLQQVDANYPSAAELSAVVKVGQTAYSMTDVGAGKSTDGSNHIISVVDAADIRPVWVCFWGGGNTLAQALYDVQSTRSAQETADFVAKIRVYDIAGQDNAGAWIANTFPDLFYLRCYDMQFGMSDTPSHGWPATEGGDNSVVTDSWVSTNIQTNHGVLGAAYPTRINVWEGDTPATFHLLPTGLNDPEKQYMGSWGGRFARTETLNPGSTMGYGSVQAAEASYRPYYMYIDEGDTWYYAAGDTTYNNNVYATIFRWRTDFQLNFAGRLDWCINPTLANKEPIAILEGNTALNEIVYLTAEAGDTVGLSGSGTFDPMSGTLSYEWFYYSEAGLYSGIGSPVITNPTSESCSVTLPADADIGEEFHIVYVVRNDGTPNMTSYRRAVITITESPYIEVPFTMSGSIALTSTINATTEQFRTDVLFTSSNSSTLTASISATTEEYRTEVLMSATIAGNMAATIVGTIVDTVVEVFFTWGVALSGGLSCNLTTEQIIGEIEFTVNSDITSSLTSSIYTENLLSFTSTGNSTSSFSIVISLESSLTTITTSTIIRSKQFVPTLGNNIIYLNGEDLESSVVLDSTKKYLIGYQNLDVEEDIYTTPILTISGYPLGYLTPRGYVSTYINFFKTMGEINEFEYVGNGYSQLGIEIGYRNL